MERDRLSQALKDNGLKKKINLKYIDKGKLKEEVIRRNMVLEHIKIRINKVLDHN